MTQEINTDNWLVTYRIGGEIKHASVPARTARLAGREIHGRYPLVTVQIEDVSPDTSFDSDDCPYGKLGKN